MRAAGRRGKGGPLAATTPCCRCRTRLSLRREALLPPATHVCPRNQHESGPEPSMLTDDRMTGWSVADVHAVPGPDCTALQVRSRRMHGRSSISRNGPCATRGERWLQTYRSVRCPARLAVKRGTERMAALAHPGSAAAPHPAPEPQPPSCTSQAFQRRGRATAAREAVLSALLSVASATDDLTCCNCSGPMQSTLFRRITSANCTWNQIVSMGLTRKDYDPGECTIHGQAKCLRSRRLLDPVAICPKAPPRPSRSQ